MSVAELKEAAKGNAVAKPKTIGDLSKFLADRMGQIKSVVASNLTPEKMCRVALNELRNNEYLAKLAIQNPASFVNAIVQASHLGLEIGGVLGQAYLVPYKNEIKMIPGYRGLISMARRSGEISSINAEIVYENDEFDLELGIQTKVKHKPKLNGDRGKPMIAYMVAHFKSGGSHFEWMTIDEVMKIKNRSASVKSGRSSPWDTDESEMIKKTVIRRGWKYLPMSIEMQQAAIVDTAIEQDKNVVIDGESFVVDTGTGEILEPQAGGQQFNDDELREHASSAAGGVELENGVA
ncbi:recombinase RecT [Nitrosomonas sp. Nm34]|uniref:recombinase RecT n=1 Tax=Nitrosomonas sp. Nm34 TaxID=1881055 RepID=UPI0008ECB092|nr:recombinase RecT [Nitrosomonas sp. Nm34]SFI76485.1 recombination protein RecT [Nitrosomonas sp. Nm34]